MNFYSNHIFWSLIG